MFAVGNFLERRSPALETGSRDTGHFHVRRLLERLPRSARVSRLCGQVHASGRDRPFPDLLLLGIRPDALCKRALYAPGDRRVPSVSEAHHRGHRVERVEGLVQSIPRFN